MDRTQSERDGSQNAPRSDVSIFLDEARELVVDAESAVVLLEVIPDDDALLARVLRSADTIKGTSVTLELHEIAALACNLEVLAQRVRGTAEPVLPSDAAALARATASLRAQIERARGSSHTSRWPTEPDGLARALQARMRAAGGSPAREVRAQPEVGSELDAILPMSERPRRITTRALAVLTLADIEELDYAITPAPVPRPVPIVVRQTTEASDSDSTQTKKNDDAASLRALTERLERVAGLVSELSASQAIVSRLVNASDASPLELVAAVTRMDQCCKEAMERVLREPAVSGISKGARG